MKKSSLLLSLFFLFGILRCQNNIGDSKNNSSIKINDKEGGIISFNLLEKRIVFSYSFTSSKRNTVATVEASGSSKDKEIATLFEKGHFNPDFNFTVNYAKKIGDSGDSDSFSNYKTNIAKLQEQPKSDKLVDEYKNKHQVTHSANSTWLTFSAGFSKSIYRIFNENAIFENQLRKESFFGYKFLVGINYWNANILGQRITTGINFGYESGNNIDALGKVALEDTKDFFDPVSQTNRTLKNSIEAYQETPYADEPKVYHHLKTIPLNLDLFIAPINLENMGFYLYSRTSFVLQDLDKTDVGFGVFFFRDNNPLTAFGGVLFEACDVFDNLKLFATNKDRYKISLTIGINVIKF